MQKKQSTESPIKFQYYRFFLSPVAKQLGLFGNDEVTRDQVISEIFEKSYRIEDAKSKYAYDFKFKEGLFIFVQLGKLSSVKRNLPPENNYEVETVEHWPNCNIFINVSNDPEKGQIIAFEHKQSVFRNPLHVLRKWADEINVDIQKYGYALSINPIDSKETFWQIIKEYEGKLEEVIFTYSSPNLFQINDKLNEELKASAENHNAEKTSIILKNSQGNLKITEDNPLINQSVDYISKGGGEFKVKALGQKTYKTSAKKIKTKNVDIENLEICCNDSKTFIECMTKIFG